MPQDDIGRAKVLIQEVIAACEARMARIPQDVPRLQEESFRYQGIAAALHLSPAAPGTPAIAAKILRELPARLAVLRGPVTW